MSVLSLEGVSKRFRRGAREFVALRDVTMTVSRGEFVVVLGTRKSGRTTLLRIAAGLERPDTGVVRFEGAELSRNWPVLGRQISYCHSSFSAMEGDRVIDHVAAPLLAQRASPGQARRAAERALDRTAVKHCAAMTADELDGAESVRVAIARALAPGPSLLVIDDPTARAGLLQGDGILRLLRSLAGGEGPAVLMSTDDAMCVSGADRVLSLDDGELRPDLDSPELEPPPAEVVPLHPHRVSLESGARHG